jgi:hypothetical protein
MRTWLACLMLVAIGSVAVAADPPVPRGARVNNLKVLSDKIDDVTTADNILKSFLKPGMSDAERSKAVWIAAVKYRHQTPPPNEYLAGDWETHDPVKLLNVYGYCMCCCCSSLIEALNRLDGREARGRILNGHSVPEVKYGGSWHMYDCSLITIFPKPSSGEIASVDEIGQAIRDWYAQHPEYKGNGAKLEQLMRSDGWTGYKKGPALLAHCPYYHLGWFPARTHGWNATMAEYDRNSEVYEYGYHVGHRALFSLRPGEALVREAGNRGLYVNMAEAPAWDGLKAKAPENDLVYLKDFFPGYNGGLVGNGTHRYVPDLASGGLAAGADVYENLATGASPALRLRTGGKPGVAIVAITSPYVYLGGRLKVKAVRKAEADKVRIAISTNNGRTFTPLWAADQVGQSEAVVDLKDRIFRRYAYWLKIELTSADADGAGLEAFAVENDIQHAPRTLPWLGKGSNTITVAADQDTGLASRASTGRITPDARFAKNESTGSMGVVFDNLKVDDGSCWWKGGVGRMTVPIKAPGDLVALGCCTHIRARGAKDVVRLLLSFDDGKTWKEAAKIAGPTLATTQYFRFTQIPAGKKQALLRYELSGNNAVGIFSFRIDADYKDPRAAKEFLPFDVVYRWKEKGKVTTHRETIGQLPFTFQVETAAVPEMVSVTYEMGAR